MSPSPWKELLSYPIVITGIFVIHIYLLETKDYLIPLIFLLVPVVYKRDLRFYFKLNDFFTGLLVSALFLIPLWCILMLEGKTFTVPPLSFLIYQFFGVAFPEEVYFRGFLQESLGNKLSSIILVSLLFSISHLPVLILYGDWLSLLTFFPSLIMGYLYWKTSNIMPSVLFHFLANILVRGLSF